MTNMEVPDKIYVNFPFVEKHPWHGPMVTKQGLNRHDTIYIRKDALMEWAKETYLNENASAIRKACYKQLIDKLNSM